MESREHNTLESIIRAAKEMSQRRTPVSTPRKEITAEAMEEASEEKENITVSVLEDVSGNTSESGTADVSPDTTESNSEEASSDATDSDSENLLSAARAFSETLQASGIHFLEFSVAFLSMVKRHYQLECSDIRANSLAFYALVALDSWGNGSYTMSELAEKLQVPKQQLTKLINDLEERKLVERTHDTANRRRVYIQICDTGRELMEDVKQKMFQQTLRGLRPYSKEELQEMDHCICRLTELMERFNTEPED